MQTPVANSNVIKIALKEKNSKVYTPLAPGLANFDDEDYRSRMV